MGEKRILVFEDGSVSTDPEEVKSGDMVTWLPNDAARKVRVEFKKDCPFSDWGGSLKRSDYVVGGTTTFVGIGKQKFKYTVTTKGKGAKKGNRSDPDLIVDGGGGSGGGAKKRPAKAQQAKKRAVPPKR